MLRNRLNLFICEGDKDSIKKKFDDWKKLHTPIIHFISSSCTINNDNEVIHSIIIVYSTADYTDVVLK